MVLSVPRIASDVGELVDHIVDRFAPERIVLFGSHATGTADDGSDVDLMVVMPSPRGRLNQAVAIYQSLDHRVPVDILVRTPEQWAAQSPRDIMLRTAIREGITLYAAGR